MTKQNKDPLDLPPKEFGEYLAERAKEISGGSKWPAWKRIQSAADLPEREGRYVAKDRYKSIPETRLWEDGFADTWLFHIERYIPEPLPAFEEGDE